MQLGRPLDGPGDLLAASGGDPFVRWEVPPGAPVSAWALRTGVAFVRTSPSGRRSLTVLAPPGEAADALATYLDAVAPRRGRHTAAARPGGAHGVHDVEGHDVEGHDLEGHDLEGPRVTVPAGTLDLLGPDDRLHGGAEWEWMWTTTPPPTHPAATGVVRLEGTGATTDVTELLQAASPRHSSDPGDADVVCWLGVRDAGGRLVACGAHTEHVAGVPHLASIAVHPGARGRGLGEAVTGELVRRGLAAGAEVVTLGMYSDNEVARRMYQRLGLRCDHRWSSRRVCAHPEQAEQHAQPDG